MSDPSTPSSPAFGLTPLATATLLLASVLTTAGSMQAAVIFELSAPGVKRSALETPTNTEIFPTTGDISNSTGTFSIGNYTVTGGASIGGGGAPFDSRNMLSISNGGAVSIVFNAGIGTSNYLGFYWGGGDAANAIDLYDSSNTLVGTFSTSTLMSQPGINAYREPSYWNQPFAYVNMTLSNSTFSRIVFRQTGIGGFEIQNVTVGTFTFVPGTVTPTSVPGGTGLAALAIGAAGLRGRRRSRN
ncbi:MAG: hypothetical protein FJ257_03565 [Phycisphaerae bacterium]|nr:hypothetical protein [Phycisphaerae bacterium]